MHNGGLVYNCRSGNDEKRSDQKCILEIQPADPSDSKYVGQERKDESGMYVRLYPAELEDRCPNSIMRRACGINNIWGLDI